MSEFLIIELSSRVGVHERDLKDDMEQPVPAIIRFPSLKPRLGEHYFHCVTDPDAKWLNIVGDHFKSKRHPIFKTFDAIIKPLPEGQRKFFVLFVQTAFGPFCIYRAKWYAGQGGSILHRDENGFGYVIEPFDHWFQEHAGLWNDVGDDPVPLSER